MNVFIAGATGVLGRRVSVRLIAAGHAVTGLSRSDGNDALLTDFGVRPRRGDLFDPEEVLSAAEGADVILHLATAIPPTSRPSRRDWAMNDRIRTEGTRNLLDAAHVLRAKRYIQQSILFLYGNRNGGIVDESTPLSDDIPGFLRSARVMEEEAARYASEKGLPTITLRFGMFYSYDSGSTRGMFAAAKAGKLPVIGAGNNYWNPMNVDDAASAVVQGVSLAGTEGGLTVNVCDDGQVTSRELTEFICHELGAPPPGSVPGFLARIALGSGMYRVLRASARCGNNKAKEVLGWEPAYRSSLEGFAEEIRRWRKPGGGKDSFQ